MIVVLSDLHLQHTTHDGIRRRDAEGRVLSTEVLRNVGASAMQTLAGEIESSVESTGARHVELVFAGDVFELHRTPWWFLGGRRLRPTHAAAQAELCAATLEILELVAAECAGFFEAIGALVKDGIAGAPVRTHFLPGNHDRLVNEFPEARARVRELLHVKPPVDGPQARFPHVLDWPRATGYGVRVRHGHEYDPQNFAAPFDPDAGEALEAVYRTPVLGDWASVDVCTRLAVSFRAHYARELRLAGEEGDAFRRIYTALAEFDDVRPQAALVRYLADAVRGTEARAFELLRPMLRDIYETARRDPFLVGEMKRLGHGELFSGVVGPLVDEALAEFPAGLVAKIMEVFDGLEGQGPGPSEVAAQERGLDSGEIELVIAGHTHQPDQVAIPGRGGAVVDAAYFVDSGTWRTRVDSGSSRTFGRLRSYTTVFCYHDEETKRGERRRFETWTGHLRSSEFGPRIDAPVALDTKHARQWVEFQSCSVERIDEGDTRDGAELELTFGVDGSGTSRTFAGVHDGDVLSLAGIRMEVDPHLDGELWCFGCERDVGIFFDRDDPMPWAVDFLRRSEDGRFALRPGVLQARDARGWAYAINYVVREGE
jgi:UDP-2,3-diacylglucosamine pyrophosphatase LpxH